MSSTRRFVGPIVLLSAGSMTGTAVLTSTALNISYLDSVSLLLNWTGTPNGTFVVQGSCDGGTTYENLAPVAVDGSALTATGAAGHHTVNLKIQGMTHIQVVYTNSSSTGTLTVTATGAGV